MIAYLLRESPLLFFNKNIRQPRILCGVGRARFGQSFSTKDQIWNQNWRCHDWTYRRLCDGICHVIIYWLFFILCWKLQASLHLIQELFVEIADGVKVPHKVLSLISKMKNSMSYDNWMIDPLADKIHLRKNHLVKFERITF